MPDKVIVPKIYLAGPLFGVADRVHNLNLKRALERLGYRVILPQHQANKFFRGGRFDLVAVVKDCLASCSDQATTIIVANLDGADTGTAMEYGYALAQGTRIVTYATDIRMDPEKEAGINAMLQVPGTRFVYYPSAGFDYLPAVFFFYRCLARKIDSEIKQQPFPAANTL
jgi:nucleoside 2-deoxyribosyltransferase